MIADLKIQVKVQGILSSQVSTGIAKDALMLGTLVMISINSRIINHA